MIDTQNIIESFTLQMIKEQYTFIQTDEGYFRKQLSDKNWTKITLKQYTTAKLFID